MQIVSEELALKILDMLEKGAASTTSTLTDVLNEFLNYLIFVEIMNASKFLLVIAVILLLKKAFKLFVDSKETEESKNFIKGLGVISYLTVGVVGLILSWNSLLNLGKVVFAPKIYLIEMAYDKVREFRNPTQQVK